MITTFIIYSICCVLIAVLDSLWFFQNLADKPINVTMLILGVFELVTYLSRFAFTDPLRVDLGTFVTCVTCTILLLGMYILLNIKKKVQ